MKGFVIVIAIAAVVYFGFLRSDRFDVPISVNGTTYSLNKEVETHGLTNYFYTPEGKDTRGIIEWVQLFVYDDDFPDDTRIEVKNKALEKYNLQSLKADDTLYFGLYSAKGITAAGFGSDIRIDGRPALVLYFYPVDSEEEQKDAKRTAETIDLELKRTAEQL